MWSEAAINISARLNYHPLSQSEPWTALNKAPALSAGQLIFAVNLDINPPVTVTYCGSRTMPSPLFSDYQQRRIREEITERRKFHFIQIAVTVRCKHHVGGTDTTSTWLFEFQDSRQSCIRICICSSARPYKKAGWSLDRTHLGRPWRSRQPPAADRAPWLGRRSTGTSCSPGRAAREPRGAGTRRPPHCSSASLQS